MSAMDVGKRLVELCNAGKDDEAVETLYAKDIVSIEGQGTDALPARMEGIEAIRGKHKWWSENNTVHSSQATGPFCGHRDDQFVVKFDIDLTPTGADRAQMSEVAIYTVRNDKVAQEEFLFLVP